jgi:glycosyltransferase involved in cell wall biosynthesis
MIAGGEVPGLARAIASIRAVVSEIVVADTGLTPAARAVAEGLGARVVPFPWREDFAAARNAALEAARADWLFSLDADEWIQDPASLLPLVARQADAYLLETANFVPYEDATTFPSPPSWNPPSPWWFPSSKIRLWRRGAPIRWEGIVHETLDFSAARAGCWVERASPRIFHDGLLSSPQGGPAASRGARYLSLARRAYERGEATPPILLALGGGREAAGDLIAAERLVGEALRITPAYPAAIVALSRIFERSGRTEEAKGLLLAGVRETQAAPEVLAALIRLLGPAGEDLRALGRRLYPTDPRFATVVA